ncbi:hypothetical protein L2E82_10419 [Cichorium intybus]|uniref:Uncharacterized protein n=1 Tax=Cichorium intybus TaxID=13427 RepID=A0ACB9GBJ3_CICIN|nr:hypothetical protein L2E82_10419 [Cichorium intybus]
MASAVPLEVIDDDDDFDWEAAVREIDVACNEATKQSSSGVTTTSATIYRNSNPHTSSCPKVENNKPSSSRQSTLDRFIGSTGLKSANQDVKRDAQDNVECNTDERFSDVSIDPEAAKTWIYPENVSVRDYQATITRTALFSNTLVSLPTGLGKTLIAAVVMYNYYRWFPQGKIVFSAPSRPLVTQQIEACHNIVGIPQEYAVDMTGQTSPAKRVNLWKTKQIFFLTPQVLNEDIKSGKCEVKKIVCLVLDEAHRASGDYAYCTVVRQLMAVPVHFRLLALTATPGGNCEKVQKVIDDLQISSLEYRSESDADVAPFVNDKKIELIQVEMGKDAVEVNDLLLDVMRRFYSRLSNLGVLPKRDPHTLSPHDYLTSRDKFRQAPPQNLHSLSSGEVEGIFGVLIAFCHIRKLLSSYGIRSAFEMLERKLNQGFFARFVSSNEALSKAKIIMQQNLSESALSPKFSKMLEVLKNKIPSSQGLSFSQILEEVEIMDSLAKIGTYVKATEFIGQNSGKMSKGQSQKVQQAVLEKFRSGGYNVIVATSIGEEGLDIMEVDLVICFDANISPLRMIQRMGRTVLACEGVELNGYKRKLANSKAIKKHMQNGGKNSFHFHSSPRMIPQEFRPEKVLVKLLIEKYIPRGKKVKNVEDIQTPKYKLKLTNLESDLLAKYFQPLSENNWRPSLIAFPHFQAFPSSVHKVSHSLRTGMLIDTMQNLQGLSFNDQDEETSEGYLRGENIEHQNSNIRENDSIQKEPESDILLSPIKHNSPNIQSQKPSVHSFLFGSDFTSIDSLGRVLILSIPLFPLKQSSIVNRLFPDSSPVKESHLEDLDTSFDINCVFTTPVKSQGNNDLLESSRRNTTETVLDDTESTDSKPVDFSPRLTNLLLSGVVPESPIDNRKGYPTTPDHDMLPDATVNLFQNKNNEREIETPEIELQNNYLEKCVSGSKIVGETRTPVTKLSDSSCSKDWILSSGEKSVSQPKSRLKRLRRFGDKKSGNLSDVEEIVGHRSCARSDRLSNKRGRGDKKVLNDARVFIEDEAEVSSEGSGDEDVDHGQDSYDGSFIDDRINPTMASTQAECDMMAIYRRSLLTQSPAIRTPHFPMDPSSDDVTPINQTHDGGSTSRITNRTHTTNYSASVSFNTDAGIPTTATGIPSSATGISSTATGISSTAAGIRKRKLSFSHGQSLPICNLEKEILLDGGESTAKEPPWKTEGEAMDDFDDDEFYRDIDLDALEEEAARQLRSRSEVSGNMNEKLDDQNLDFLDCPSFDLGI